MQGAFGYAGQKCSAISRVIVLEQTYDRFVERLVEVLRTAGVGLAEEPTTSIPAVIDQAAFESIREYIEIGKQEAKAVLEVDAQAAIDEHGGYYIGPVIFADVPPDARIAQEEIFGPVLSVIRAKTFDEAIAIFNGTAYALTGAVFSRSPANIDKARYECECGNFYINRKATGSRVDLQPYGGLKMSGAGARGRRPRLSRAVLRAAHRHGEYAAPRVRPERRGHRGAELIARVAARLHIATIDGTRRAYGSGACLFAKPCGVRHTSDRRPEGGAGLLRMTARWANSIAMSGLPGGCSTLTR